MTAEDHRKMDEIKRFLSDAYCIDGGVQEHFVKLGDKSTFIFEMNDSKRGRFGVAWLDSKEIDTLKSNSSREAR